MFDGINASAGSARGGFPSVQALRALSLVLALASAPLAFAGPAFTMRIDDNHSEKDWTRVADIFEKHGMKVSFAVVPAALSESQGKCLKALADRGHELMDHMPDHAFYKATYHDRCEVVIYDPAATQPCDDVLRELAGITRERFRHFGLPLPKVWIRPEGGMVREDRKVRSAAGRAQGPDDDDGRVARGQVRQAVRT